MSDRLEPRFGEEVDPLRHLLGAAVYVVAAVLFLFASRTLKRDGVER